MNCHGDLLFTVCGNGTDLRRLSLLIYYARDVFGRMGLSGRYLSEATAFSEEITAQVGQISEQSVLQTELKFKTFHDSLSVPMLLLFLASEQFSKYCPGLSLQVKYQAVPGKTDILFFGEFYYDQALKRWHMFGDMPPGGLFCPEFPTSSWETYRNLYESRLKVFELSF